MLENKAASRYAKSLIDLSTERQSLEQVKGDMELLKSVIDNHSELESILKNPIIPLDKKAGILNDAFGAKVNEITNAFLKQIVSKGRSEIILSTARSFISQYNVIKGVVVADVISATALTPENRQEIIQILRSE